MSSFEILGTTNVNLFLDISIKLFVECFVDKPVSYLK